jgi:acyl-coenzyme A thioesterase PaaI-like protein
MNRFVRALQSPPALKLLFNAYPPYLMTGITVREIASDWRRVVVRMGLHWYNRNYFGTHFGASLYAMTDPFYAIMLSRNIGPDYIVWDRAAQIEFLRPGRGRVTAEFTLTPASSSCACTPASSSCACTRRCTCAASADAESVGAAAPI